MTNHSNTNIEQGGMSFQPATEGSIPTITAFTPVDRYSLQNYIATIRAMVFHGVQVPFRVIHIDADSGEHQEEHIPGCATCSI